MRKPYVIALCATIILAASYQALRAWDDRDTNNLDLTVADSRYVNVAGDTMTGPLAISANTDNLAIDADVTLGAASGNEVAYELSYTTNKAAGNDTGLLINMTDTASPGTSYPLQIKVGGSDKLTLTETGTLQAANRVLAGSTVNANTGFAVGTSGMWPIAQAGPLLLRTDLYGHGSAGGTGYIDARGILYLGDGTYSTTITPATGSIIAEGPVDLQSTLRVASTFTLVGAAYLASKTADPCTAAPYGPGAIFWNSTATAPCYCDGSSADLRMDGTTPCF